MISRPRFPSITKMKPLLITSTLLFAMSFAEQEDLFEVSKEFLAGMSDYKVPILLARGVRTDKLLFNYANNVQGILNDFIIEYYQQAFRGKDALKRDLASATERLLENFTYSPNNSSITLNNDLIRINELLKRLTDCLPGRIIIEDSTLPDLPTSHHGQIITHLGSEKMPEIFLNLAPHVDRDLSSIHSLLNEVFLAGWQRSRQSLNKLQDYFRINILNGDILPAFVAELTKINAINNRNINRNGIEGSVESEAWKDFQQLNEHIDRAASSLAV